LTGVAVSSLLTFLVVLTLLAAIDNLGATVLQAALQRNSRDILVGKSNDVFKALEKFL
jgi:hypothetical protein